MTKRADHDELLAAIRGRGLRATPARVAVYAALLASRRPVSHAELLRRLARQDLDRVTVFRNLAALVRAALVRRIDLGDRVWRFVAAGSAPAWSVEFVCTSCGSTAALRDVQLHVAMAGAPRAIARREVELEVRGRCDACAR